ncbi:hypothetical protein TYRP_009888 [Tyrophagus putrescentiae]|nr:hypothetical protein TYRP_009888 [Tyrophagus putrescentiae]
MKEKGIRAKRKAVSADNICPAMAPMLMIVITVFKTFQNDEGRGVLSFSQYLCMSSGGRQAVRCSGDHHHLHHQHNQFKIVHLVPFFTTAEKVSQVVPS